MGKSVYLKIYSNKRTNQQSISLPKKVFGKVNKGEYDLKKKTIKLIN